MNQYAPPISPTNPKNLSLWIPLGIALVVLLFAFNKANAQESIEFLGEKLYLDQNERIIQKQSFKSSVTSQLVVVQDQNEQQTMVTILDTSGIAHGLQNLASPVMLQSYLEGIVVGWGGKLEIPHWDWSTDGKACREIEALFGAKAFCYQGCMHSADLQKIWFAVRWEEGHCTAKDKESLPQWLIKHSQPPRAEAP